MSVGSIVHLRYSSFHRSLTIGRSLETLVLVLSSFSNINHDKTSIRTPDIFLLHQRIYGVQYLGRDPRLFSRKIPKCFNFQKFKGNGCCHDVTQEFPQSQRLAQVSISRKIVLRPECVPERLSRKSQCFRRLNGTPLIHYLQLAHSQSGLEQF